MVSVSNTALVETEMALSFLPGIPEGIVVGRGMN